MRTTTLMLAALTVMAAAGCRQTADAGSEDMAGMARTDYSAEKNEVTVEPLEYRTFHKQLICNGRVQAS